MAEFRLFVQGRELLSLVRLGRERGGGDVPMLLLVGVGPLRGGGCSGNLGTPLPDLLPSLAEVGGAFRARRGLRRKPDRREKRLYLV